MRTNCKKCEHCIQASTVYAVCSIYSPPWHNGELSFWACSIDIPTYCKSFSPIKKKKRKGE